MMALKQPSRARDRTPAPRLALRPEEAAQAIGVGRSFFYKHILPELHTVQRGGARLIPVSEIERWLDSNAEGEDLVPKKKSRR